MFLPNCVLSLGLPSLPSVKVSKHVHQPFNLLFLEFNCHPEASSVLAYAHSLLCASLTNQVEGFFVYYQKASCLLCHLLSLLRSAGIHAFTSPCSSSCSLLPYPSLLFSVSLYVSLSTSLSLRLSLCFSLCFCFLIFTNLIINSIRSNQLM